MPSTRACGAKPNRAVRWARVTFTRCRRRPPLAANFSMNFSGLSSLRFLMEHPLAALGPFAAIARYLRWQLGSRILGEPVVVSFVNDARLLVRRGMTGATGNVYAGLHEY